MENSRSKKILEKKIEKLETYREQLLNTPTITVSFGTVKHGLDAAGDLSGAFKHIREGFLKEIDFDLKDAREHYAKIMAEEWWGSNE